MSRLAVCIVGCVLAGCSGAPKPAEAVGVSHTSTAAISYSFDSLDQRAVSSEAAKGRPVVVAFIATWDMMSQAQADFLSAMAKTDGDKVAYFLVALDERGNRELVEAFASTLGLTCPVAIGDAETIAGRSGFGDVTVPTVVVLDPESHIAWRKTGLAKSDELRKVLASVERAASLGLSKR